MLGKKAHMHSSYFQEFDQLLTQEDTKSLIDELSSVSVERLSVLYNKLAVHIFHSNEKNQDIERIRQQTEQFRPVVHYAVEQLLRLYLKQGDRLSRQNESVAISCKRLLNVQYKSYMILLEHARKRVEEKELLAIVIHRIMVIQLYLHIISYMMYNAIAGKEWLNLHRLFIIAKQNNLSDFSVEDEDCYVKNPVSVSELYSLSLLMGCASLHQLNVESIIKAVSCVFELASLVTISEKPQGLENEIAFDISSGAAPNFRKFFPENEHSVFQYLHLEKLLTTIKKHRTEGDTLFNKADFPDHLKSHLIEAWSKYRVREQRVVVNQELEATIGLGNIHYYLSGGRELKEFLGLSDDRSIVCEDETKISLIEQQQSDDVWSPGLSVPVHQLVNDDVKEAFSFQRYFEMSEDVDTETYTTFNIKKVDRSIGGCCLEFPSQVHFELSIGMLIGFRDAITRSHWQVGEIAWFKIVDDEKMHVGVRLLSTEAIPVGVDVSFVSGIQGNYTEGVLLPYENELKHLTSILVPDDIYDEGFFLKAVQKGLVNDLKLTNNIHQSEYFTQFNCGFYVPEIEQPDGESQL